MSNKFLLSDQFDEDEEVLSCSIKHSWIGHGLFAAIASIIAIPITGFTVSHYWVNIQTNKGFYNSQFYGFIDSFLSLTRHDQHHAADQAGTGFLIHEKDVMTAKKPCQVKNRKKMKDVLQFMKNWNPSYSVFTNNCQHFSKKLYWLLTAHEDHSYVANCQHCQREIRFKDMHKCIDCRTHYSTDCFSWL